MDASEYPPSPVPSDRDLPEDELPFTAFAIDEGQLDLRVFEQDIWWVDIHGDPHPLAEMSEEYLSNVIGHLQVYVLHYFTNVLMKTAFEVIYDSLTGRPNAELLSRAAGGPRITELTREEWLESTPLMRELRRRLDRRQPRRS